MYNNITETININNGYSQPTNKYIFELFIYDDKQNETHIKKKELKPHSKIINFNDKIKFDDIHSFKIYITHELDGNTLDYSLEDDIKIGQTTSIHHNDYIFIEFTNNTNGYSLCSCALKIHNIFMSPPNY